MSMIEGVGDEVTVCFGIFSILSLMIVAWLSTHVNDPIIRVVVLDRDTFRRLIRRIRNIQTGLTGTPTPPSEPVTSDTSNASQEAQPSSDDVQTHILVTESSAPQNDSASLLSRDTEPPASEEPSESLSTNSEIPLVRDSSEKDSVPCDSSEDKASSPSETSATDGTQRGTEVKQESAETPQTEQPAEIPEGSLRIKIKYIDDRQKVVFVRPEITIGKFKRDNFSAELSENLAVRFIYNGQELKQDSQTLQAYNVQNDCVIHCLLSRVQQEPPDTQRAQSPDLAIDIGFLMFPLFGLILALIWYCRFTYRNYFNAMSTFSLIGITFLFLIAVLSTFRNHGGEAHEHQD